MIVSQGPYIVAHRVEDGRFAWKVDRTDFFDPSHEGWQPVELHGLDVTRDSVRVGLRSVLEDPDSKKRTVTEGVYALDSGTGDLQWRTTLASPTVHHPRAPPVGDEMQFFATSDNVQVQPPGAPQARRIGWNESLGCPW